MRTTIFRIKNILITALGVRIRPRMGFLPLAAATLIISAHAAVVPPDELTVGKTSGEWMAACFQWLMQSPFDSSHPLRDQTGAYASRGQSGPVWFLGGVSNDSGIATRLITI